MSVTPITTTPTLINATAYNLFTSSIGPAAVGASLYVALIDLSNNLFVLKSTDSGATWSRMNPAGGTTGIAFTSSALFTATQLLFFWSNEQSFTFATDLFSAAVVNADGPFTGASRIRSDGSALSLWRKTSTASIKGQLFSAGAFAASFNVYTEVGIHSPDVIGLAVDSGDVGHALYLDNDSGLVKYSTIVGASTVAGPVALAVVPAPAYSSLAVGGNVYYAWAPTFGTTVRLLVGIGATSNPATAVWTDYLVRTPGVGTLDAYPVVVADGADIQVFFANETASGGGGTVYSARFNGSGFDAPVVFYDSATYPPAGGLAAHPFMSFLSITKLGSAFVGTVALELADFSQPTFYLANPSAPASGYRHRIY